MTGLWSFDRRITSGFVLMAVLVIATSLVAVFAARTLIPRLSETSKVRGRMLYGAMHYQAITQTEIADAQTYLLTGRPEYLASSTSRHQEALALMERLLEREPDPEARRRLEGVRQSAQQFEDALRAAILLRVTDRNADALLLLYRREVAPARDRMDAAVARYVERARWLLRAEDAASRQSLSMVRRWSIVVAIVALLLFGALAVPLRQTLLGLYQAESEQRAAAAAARELAEALARTREEGHETTRQIVENALDAVIGADAAGRIMAWNPEASRVFGWSADEVIGRMARDTIIPERYHGALDAWLTRAATTGSAPILGQRVEITARRRDGSEFPIEIALSAPRREGVHFSAFVRDIGERRRIDQQIRESEAEFRATFDQAGVGYALLELPAGRFARVNPKLCEILGYSAEDLGTRTLADVTCLDDPDSPGGDPAPSSRNEVGRQSEEMRLCRKDGHTVFALVTTSLIEASNGHAQRALSVIQDLSELRQARSALQATEDRFQLMADSAPVLVWLTAADGSYTWFNRPWLEFTGHSMTQELGRGWMAGVHPSDDARLQDSFRGAFAQREPFTVEYRLRRHDGEWRWLLGHGIPLHASDGEFTGYIGSCIDISDRKRSEDQREQLLASERVARNEAERASRMKDEFLATLSHELRTPLQAMLGWSRLLSNERLDDAQRRRGLEIIERNVTLQKRLIEDLLDMSRIVQGKTRLDVKPIDLCTVIEAAIDVVRPAAEAKAIQLSRTLEPAAGAITGDAQRLQQVMWNLLSNAIKFTPGGGRVDVSLHGERHRVFVSVRDSGQGIRGEFVPRVFERFLQDDSSTTRRQSGLGLGLAIVKHLIELHGGRVSATSAGEDRGATFTVELPRHAPVAIEHDASEGAEVPVMTPVSSGPPPDSLAGIRVLVVDDEPDACELLRHVFEARGANVETARSAREALERFVEFRPQALVSDIGMPETDGYQLMRQIRTLEGGADHATPEVAAVALTAFARPDDRVRAMRAGFHAHVAKPAEPAELVATLVQLLAEIPLAPGDDMKR